MFKNPFGPTNVNPGPAATPAIIGEGVEVRYSPIARTLVPGVMLLSGIMVPVILYMVLPSPFNITMAVVTAVMELLTAAALWAVFNLSFVRADEIGVTRSLMGRKVSVSWAQVAKMEVKESPKSPQTHFKLLDQSKKTLLEFSDLGNRADGVKLHQFIKDKLKNQE
jgi:hypothetical protein